MKKSYLDGQFVLQAEQEHDFLKKADIYSHMTIPSFAGPEEEDAGERAGMEREMFETLYPYVAEDFEILRLYIAVYAADMTRSATVEGVPANITENLKKQAFAGIVKARRQSELGEVILGLRKKLRESYRRYAANRYSYNVQRAVEYIQTQRFQPVSAGSVAAFLGVDRSNLSRSFHREVGMTMTDYIHTIKTDLAEELIDKRNYSLMEVSDLLGYSSYPYFCKVFKKYKHRRPSQPRPADESRKQEEKKPEKDQKNR